MFSSYRLVENFVTYRIWLIYLNILYIVVGCILIGVAACGKPVSILDNVSVMGGLVVCGVVLMLIAIVGLIGVFRHNQAVLFFYILLLSSLFAVQFILSCTCLAVSPVAQHMLFHLAWKRASNKTRVEFQDRYNCCGCGSENISSLGNSTDKCSELCCLEFRDQNATIVKKNCSRCYQTCWQVVKPRLRRALRTVGGFGLFFSFTEIIGICLTFAYRNQKDPRASDANVFI